MICDRFAEVGNTLPDPRSEGWWAVLPLLLLLRLAFPGG